MVCVSIYTHRPAQPWRGRVLCLPGLVELITQSGVDLTFYRKTKNYHNNEAYLSVLYVSALQVLNISNFTDDMLALKRIRFYITKSMVF